MIRATFVFSMIWGWLLSGVVGFLGLLLIFVPNAGLLWFGLKEQLVRFYSMRARARLTGGVVQDSKAIQGLAADVQAAVKDLVPFAKDLPNKLKKN